MELQSSFGEMIQFVDRYTKSQSEGQPLQLNEGFLFIIINSFKQY